MIKNALSLTIIFASLALVYATPAKKTGLSWGYTAYDGPETSAWPDECRTGTQQSPINIDQTLFSKGTGTTTTPDVSKLPNVYTFKAINRGHTVEFISPEPDSFIPITLSKDGYTYHLAGFHFHTPSEHRVDNIHSDAEVHFVFKTSSSSELKIAVVGFFLQAAEEGSDYISSLFANGLPGPNIGDEVQVQGINIGQFFKDSNNLKEAYQYDGSLTTPPCSEGLKWHVNPQIYPISLPNYHDLRRNIGFSARTLNRREDNAGEAHHWHTKVLDVKTWVHKMQKVFESADY
ncbi:hypothetical protein G9A89_002211 [Geosiphon pyriformis]|nr:hypothetical protein G9A89_002211 [Geosiphon pyriformis]